MTISAPPRTASLLNWGYTRFVYPTFESSRYRGFAGRLKTLAEREKMSIGQNEDLQWQALLKLFKHAHDTSPFYQRRFAECGVRIDQIQSPVELKTIPPLTREDIRGHLPDIQSRQFNSRNLHHAATGGTTDTPVPILRDADSLLWKSAVQWRFNSWGGLFPGDKVFNLWGARQDYSENPSWRWRLYDRQLMRRVWAPTSVLNNSVFQDFRTSLNQLQPKVIYAYPTPLAAFCEFLRDSGRPFHQPQTAICTAEPLVPEQRKTIEEVLGCRVFELYGSREFGMVAAECEQHNGMHLNPAAAYFEYLPVENSDIPGLHEILLTDLLNYGMPLLRYQTNDCVILPSRQCNCGRGYPVLPRIIGRIADMFQLPNGDRIPGVSLTNRVLKVCAGLKKTQIIQESLTEFRIRYVAGPEFSGSDLDLLKTNLQLFVPGEIRWTFESVDQIPREASGKTRFCISKVQLSAPAAGAKGS